MAYDCSPGCTSTAWLGWIQIQVKWAHSVSLCSPLSGDYFAWLWIVSSTDITLKKASGQKNGDITKHNQLWWRIPETVTLLMLWAKLKKKKALLANAPAPVPGTRKQDTHPKLWSQGHTFTPQHQQVSLQISTPALSLFSLYFTF